MFDILLLYSVLFWTFRALSFFLLCVCSAAVSYSMFEALLCIGDAFGSFISLFHRDSCYHRFIVFSCHREHCRSDRYSAVLNFRCKIERQLLLTLPVQCYAILVVAVSCICILYLMRVVVMCCRLWTVFTIHCSM